MGNHFFGGDDEDPGLRRAGLVFTTPTPNAILTGNYIDNSFIELSNEHDAQPEFDAEFSFGGMTITGNIFVSINTLPSFRWLVVSPKGPGHTMSHLSITGNTFRTISGTIDRIDAVDATVAGLDYSRFRNINITNNAFSGVNQHTKSPVVYEHVQNTNSATWVVDAGAFLPFASRARNVQSAMPKGTITNATNVVQYVAPYALLEQGTAQNQVHLKWPSAVKGRAMVTIHCDNPN